MNVKSTDLLKTTIFLERKFEEDIFGETFNLALSSSAVICLQNRVSDFFCYVGTPGDK